MTVPGRTQLRPDQSKSYCSGCDVRITIGEPVPSNNWASRLHLTREQVDLILEAAAEFDLIAASWDDRPTAVEFTDWLAVDALRTGINEPPFYDGAPARNLAGEVASGRDAAYRHPDPLPFAPIRRTRP